MPGPPAVARGPGGAPDVRSRNGGAGTRGRGTPFRTGESPESRRTPYEWGISPRLRPPSASLGPSDPVCGVSGLPAVAFIDQPVNPRGSTPGADQPVDQTIPPPPIDQTIDQAIAGGIDCGVSIPVSTPVPVRPSNMAANTRATVTGRSIWAT